MTATPIVATTVTPQFLAALNANFTALDAATVSTLADLKAIAYRPSVVSVAGKNSVGDGWGGAFAWVAGDSTTADDALVVQCTSGAAGRYKRIYAGAVNVKWFGAVLDGVTDDTVAVQAAVDSGNKAVYIPPGTCLVSNILMPNVFGFTLFGQIGGSALKPKSGASNAVIYWNTAAIVYNEQYVRDITIIGTNGSQHCIDTSGAGGLTLDGIYITDVPVGKSGIYMNGAAATQVHDLRLNNIQIYSNTAGHSGIRCGPLCADSQIKNFIMNGALLTQYGIYFDNGAVNITVEGSHPYNCANNIVFLAGANNKYIQFNTCSLDRANLDLVNCQGGGALTFLNCYFEGVAASKSALILNATTSAKVVGCIFGSVAGGSTSCVVESGGSNNTTVAGCIVDALGNFSAPWNLSGSSSAVRLSSGGNPLGVPFGFSGVGQSPQAQNTTQYYGVNGLQSGAGATQFVVPYPGTFNSVVLAVDNTPAAAQTFTFNVFKNGLQVGTGSIANGSFGVTISLSTAVVAGDTVYIQSVFSATSGSATVRYYANFMG